MIPYVMDDTKALTTLVADTSNGLGRLAECTSLNVTEGLSGEYTATMVIPTEAYNSGLVHRGGIIKAKANGKDPAQLFRVARFKETLSSGLIECDLEHISYDLNKTVLRSTVTAVVTTTVSQFLDLLNGNMSATVHPSGVFTAASNMTGSTSLNGVFLYSPATPRQLLLGENGVCATHNWQMHWNNLTYTLMNRRGADKTDSVIVAYGKNIVDFSDEQDTSEVYDGVMGYVYVPSKWKGSTVSDVKSLVYGHTPQHILLVDLSEKAQDMTSKPATSTVNAWTDAWIAANDPSIPKVAINIDLVSLEDNGEYDKLKELEGLELGDTITVKVNGTSVNATITEVTYDSLTERYTEIKLGNYQPSLENTILGLVGGNASDLSNTKQEYNATFQSMRTELLFDTFQTNASSDWNTERYNEYEIDGNGFIIIMVNAYTATTGSYGNISASVQHSTDRGSTWGYDAYTAHRHGSNDSNAYDGTAITVPMAVVDNELVRCTWKITKEVQKACRVKILGIGVTATQTVSGGAI